jgi:hypothetical protein
MRETTLNRGQGVTNFIKERHNVNIGVRKVRCPHKFCQDCSIVIVDNSDVSDLYSKVPLLNPTYHLTLSQTETYILCVDLIIIIVKQFFPNLNLDTNTFNIQQ